MPNPADPRHSPLRAHRPRLLLAALPLLTALPLDGQSVPAADADSVPAYTAFRAAAPIRVDGVLSAEEWGGAAEVELAWEAYPGDNTPAPVRTACRIAYDRDHLYLGCAADDPEPRAIRARLADRDRPLDDDHVVLWVDPFRDRRRAYEFRINPRGVQMDALYTQAEGTEDFGWDAIWSSAGTLTGGGYTVEAAIPLRALRVPGGASPRRWGFILERYHPRDVPRRTRSIRTDRDDACLLCQAAALDGMAQVARGRNLELASSATAARTDRRPAGAEGLDDGGVKVEPGVTARWGASPNVTVEATLNPDFSQVEADAAQLEVNTRFPLSYPEKRPFFVEGSDLFATFVPVVFTRTVVDPVGGAKVVGRQGAGAFAGFVTRDRVGYLLFSGPQASRSTLLDREVTTGVLRYQRDVGRASSVGMVYTGRTGSGYGNQVAGPDLYLRLSPANSLRAQVVGSATDYPDSTSAAFGQRTEAFAGWAGIAQLTHASRDWSAYGQVQSVDRAFRADAGFVPRVGVRVVRGRAQRWVWGGRERWFTRMGFGVFADRLTGVDGQVLGQNVTALVDYAGPRQSKVGLRYGALRERAGDRLYHLREARATLEAQPGRDWRVSLAARVGHEVDYANLRRGDAVRLEPAAEVQLGHRASVQLAHTYHRLSSDGRETFTANLSQLRGIYHLNARTFVRAIVQYRTLKNNPDAFVQPVEPEERRLFSQLLFSYRVNPRTALYVGYSGNQLGERETDLAPTDRTFFLKLGYAWQL